MAANGVTRKDSGRLGVAVNKVISDTKNQNHDLLLKLKCISYWIN